MKTFYSAIIIIFLTVICITSINIIGKHTLDNDNLNQDSLDVLIIINNSVENDYNLSTLSEVSGINGTNPEDEDSFGFEFLSAKSSAQKKISILSVIYNTPSLIVGVFGFKAADSQPFINIIGWFLTILIGIITFNAIFNRRVDNG